MWRCKPRASGDDPRAAVAATRASAVNPARAGMILVSAAPSPGSVGKPRASGDDPLARDGFKGPDG